MRRQTELMTGIVVLLLSFSAMHAQLIKASNCVVDLEILRLPPCAVEWKNGQSFVRPEFVNAVGDGRWNDVGHIELAWTNLTTGWSYFDRHGRIVVTHVAVFDNGPSPFHYGLVRVEQNGKWGLANPNGRLIVPLVYDGMLEFDSGRWLACSGCITETSGEYHNFNGGSWVALDRVGKLIGPTGDPTHR